MQNEQIPIAIIDDHTLFRQGVAGLLKEFDELSIVFEAGNGKEMQEKLLHQELPEVILMDINMPVMDGCETTTWLKINFPEIRVLALSMYDDDDIVLKMIKCGACGYVLKESRPSELLGAIKQVKEKGVFLNDLVSGKLMKSFNHPQDISLSKKELEFIILCCSELTYKEIADKMCVSPRTVDNYRESLFQKLNLKSRTGLVLYAIKHSLFKF